MDEQKERAAFEAWFADYNPAGKSDKQRAQDAYRAALAAAPAQAQQVEPYAHIVELPSEYGGPTKFFTAPSDPRGFPVYRHPPKAAAPAPAQAKAAAYRALKTGALMDAAEVEALWPTEPARAKAMLAPLFYVAPAPHPDTADAEPVAWAVYNGVCPVAVHLSSANAAADRDRRQMSHELSGSLSAHRIVPVYAARAQAQKFDWEGNANV